MKARPRCAHSDFGRQCPDSAGYVIISRLPPAGDGPGPLVQIPGGFCRRHAKCGSGQQRLALGTQRQAILV